MLRRAQTWFERERFYIKPGKNNIKVCYVNALYVGVRSGGVGQGF